MTSDGNSGVMRIPADAEAGMKRLNRSIERIDQRHMAPAVKIADCIVMVLNPIGRARMSEFHSAAAASTGRRFRFQIALSVGMPLGMSTAD